MTNTQTRTFAIIVEGDVIATIIVPETSPNAEMLWAGFSSNPIIIEASDTPGVGLGWTYNSDGTFNPPSGV